MGRTPNYRFDRMQREKAKAAKVAEKAKAKAEAKEKERARLEAGGLPEDKPAELPDDE
jgi:hypothetical protein